MPAYTVHMPVKGDDEIQRASQAMLVADGFSRMALVLGPFWMLWHRLWRESPLCACDGLLAVYE